MCACLCGHLLKAGLAGLGQIGRIGADYAGLSRIGADYAGLGRIKPDWADYAGLGRIMPDGADYARWGGPCRIGRGLRGGLDPKSRKSKVLPPVNTNTRGNFELN